MPTYGLAPLHTRCPDLAVAETRTFRLRNPEPLLPDDDYGFDEYYCTDPGCDCRRALICVVRRGAPGQILCAINFGWESEEFYRGKFSFMEPEEIDDAVADVTAGALDPHHSRGEGPELLLACFHDMIAGDPDYVARLGRHYAAFRAAESSVPPDEETREEPPPPAPASKASKVKKISEKRRARFDDIAGRISEFGERHLDEDLTSFALELWARVCQKRDAACERGKPEVWAASVVHVIARLNFLYDRSQPVHISLDDTCDHFGTKKTTVGNKATQIERSLKLNAHAEPGLCRRELVEKFTMVRSPEGMVMPFNLAKEQGFLPPDMEVEDLW